MISSRICPCKPRWNSSSIRLCHSISNNKFRCRYTWCYCVVCSRKSYCCLKNSVRLCWYWRGTHSANVYCHWNRFSYTWVRCKVEIDIHCTCHCGRWVWSRECYYRNTSTGWNCRNIRRIIPVAFLSFSWCGSTNRWSCACPKFTIYAIVDPRLGHNFCCSIYVISDTVDPVCGCASSISCVWATIKDIYNKRVRISVKLPII